MSLRLRGIMAVSCIAILFFLVAGCSSFWEEEVEEYMSGDEVPLSKLAELQQMPAVHQLVCEPFEIYDADKDECYLPKSCETVEDCAALGDELADQIYDRYGDLLTDYEFDGEGDTYDEQLLVKYRLKGERLTNPKFVVVDAQFASYRDDLDMHVYIWDLFKYLIPKEMRTMLSGFTIFTDGNEETLAHVEPDEKNVNNWLLGVDVMDADESFILISTLLHEYAHLLTLQKEQIDMNKAVLFADEGDAIHQEAMATCDSYFVEWMGCAKETSYIHQFYMTFWDEMIDEWQERGVAYDEEEADAFYEDYEERFVTNYAVVSPDEDIAEVWTYFILSPQPKGDDIWKEKILFFYQYPEQVKLRAEVLSRLLSYLSRTEE